MYKLVLFANAKARADYFAQQYKFVSEEGRKDLYAEISTNVEGEVVQTALCFFFHVHIPNIFEMLQ